MEEWIEKFQNPPREYSAVPLWFWNGTLCAEELRRQIGEMADKGVYGAFMHARAYLKTPYLEKEWWDAVEACVEEGKKKGFKAWIYDEYAWPSGTAGSIFEYGYQKPSRVLAKGERNMAKGLEVRSAEFQEGENAEAALEKLLKGERREPLAVYLLEGEGESLSIARLEGGRIPGKKGRLTAFYRKVYENSVDYMNPETIRQFIEETYEEYWKRFGAEFGKTIPGAFFDEIFMAGKPVPWTDRFPEEFRKQCGYEVWGGLPWLMEGETEEARAFRRDYYRVAANLYETAFFRQISEWCREHGLRFTGHTEEVLKEHPRRQGNYFDTMRHLDIPGSDIHGYRYGYPRWIKPCEPKYAVSVARAYGKERAMAESMGGAGWACSLQQFKQGINVMAGLGTNMFVLHGFYYECEHQGSQGDWPPSLFYQNPYWKYFKIFADYMSRISFLNSLGRPAVQAGLYYPIEALAETAAAGENTPEGQALQEAFYETMYGLLRHQIDVDMIDGKSLLEAEVSGGLLKTGSQQFSVLILPEYGTLSPGMEEKLKAFAGQGGIVLAYACLKNGRPNQEFLTDGVCAPEKLYEKLLEKEIPDLRILRGNRYGLFANCRVLEKERWYFLGSGADEEKDLRIWVRGEGAVWWLDPETGERRPAEALREKDGFRVSVHLAPAQAGWLLLSEEPCAHPLTHWQEDDCQQIGGRFEIQVLGGEAKEEWQEDLPGGRLEIPVCLFSSSLDERPREIRAVNRRGEEGGCGRYFSGWKGSWITRRAFWHDDTEAEDLYFRRKIYLEEEPRGGRICAATVDTAEIFLNGQSCGWVSGFREPGILPAENWKKGWNLLAVHVKNRHPIEDCDMCAAEELPLDRYISLLLEAEIETDGETKRVGSDGKFLVCAQEREGWNLLETDYEREARRIPWEIAKPFGGPDADWTYAWERGRMPLLPWGDLPLFGKKTEYPARAFYQFTLPAGTSLLYRPAVKGTAEYFLDGRKILEKGETETIEVDGLPHIFQISVRVSGPEDGLKKPVETETAPFLASLGDWRAHGLKWFSGFVRYRQKFTVKKRPGRYLLRLGQVCFHGEVWVNKRLAGVKLWQPYELDVTDFVKDGENELTVIVSNSAANERRYLLVDEGKALGWNRYWNEDNIDRDGENLLSGLLGPVKLYHRYEDSQRQ